MIKMHQKIVSLDTIKLGIKHILKQVHYLPVARQKEAIHFIVKSLKNLKTSISLNSGRLRQRHLLFSKCIAKCKNSDGFYRFVIRRKEYGLKSISLNNEYNVNESSQSDIEDETELNTSNSPENIEENKGIVENENSTNYNVSCCLCSDVSFSNYNSITTHIFNHAGSPVSCNKCKQSFNNLTMFKIHHNVDCSQSVGSNSKDFLLNLANVVKNFNQKTHQRYYCPYCGQGFVKTFNLKRHLKNKCGENFAKYHCITCNKKFNNEVRYSQHLQQHTHYKCLNCELHFHSKKLLKQHSRIHRKVKIYTCELCNVDFPNRVQYRLHIGTHNRDKTIPPVEKLWRVWCNVCQISFFDDFTYKRHCTRKSHLSKVTDDKELLNMKTFMCVKCGQTFRTSESLKTHCSRIHGDKARLSCDKCMYTTLFAANLKRHILSHNKTINKRLFCHQCPSTFPTSSHLKEHIVSEHAEERLFACDLCPETFKLKKLLNRHKTIHSPSLPFECLHCSVGFKRKANLKRHTEAKHKGHVPKPPVLVIDKTSDIQDTLGETSKLLPMPSITIDSKDIRENNIQGDNRVFSLIDAQSGELVTLSATELSKNAVINMSDGELLNEVHIPELWNHPNTIYTLDPILQSNVLPQPQYNILTHDGNEMSQMLLQKTLESSTDKNSIQYCIVPPNDVQAQRTEDELRYFYV